MCLQVLSAIKSMALLPWKFRLREVCNRRKVVPCARQTWVKHYIHCLTIFMGLLTSYCSWESCLPHSSSELPCHPWQSNSPKGLQQRNSAWSCHIEWWYSREERLKQPAGYPVAPMALVVSYFSWCWDISETGITAPWFKLDFCFINTFEPIGELTSKRY